MPTTPPTKTADPAEKAEKSDKTEEGEKKKGEEEEREKEKGLGKKETQEWYGVQSKRIEGTLQASERLHVRDRILQENEEYRRAHAELTKAVGIFLDA